MSVTTGPRRSPAKAVIASWIGTTIEYYDFLIYGTAASVVFQKVFFPELGPTRGTALAFVTFGVAYVTRPLGAIVFGHFGDRIGRKTTLVTTLLLMGLSTVAIGLVPSAASIGIAAPVLLIVLRLAQGIAVGGEWAGAALLVSENAPPALRGRYSLFPQLGPAVGLILASATFLVVNASMSQATFLADGWRIPFLASAVLIVVGLYVRLRVGETAAYRRAGRAVAAASTPPIVESIRRRPREIVLAAGAVATPFMLFIVATTYLANLAVAAQGLSSTQVFAVTVLGGVVLGVAVVGFAVRSDRVGRRRTIVLGNTLAAGFGLLVIPIMNIGTVWAFALCVVGSMFCTGVSYGTLAAFVPELFPTRYRYTGAGTAYILAGVLGGALTPLILTALTPFLGGYAVSLFMAVFALGGVACTMALPETGDVVLDAGPEQLGDAVA